MEKCDQPIRSSSPELHWIPLKSQLRPMIWQIDGELEDFLEFNKFLINWDLKISRKFQKKIWIGYPDLGGKNY